MTTDAKSDSQTDERTDDARRRPYEPPRVRSGPAFETVELQSCNSTVLTPCEFPC